MGIHRFRLPSNMKSLALAPAPLILVLIIGMGFVLAAEEGSGEVSDCEKDIDCGDPTFYRCVEAIARGVGSGGDVGATGKMVCRRRKTGDVCANDADCMPGERCEKHGDQATSLQRINQLTAQGQCHPQL